MRAKRGDRAARLRDLVADVDRAVAALKAELAGTAGQTVGTASELE